MGPYRKRTPRNWFFFTTGPKEEGLSPAPDTTETEGGAVLEFKVLSERPRTMPENHEVVVAAEVVAEVELVREDGVEVLMSALVWLGLVFSERRKGGDFDWKPVKIHVTSQLSCCCNVLC